VSWGYRIKGGGYVEGRTGGTQERVGSRKRVNRVGGLKKKGEEK